MLSVEEKINDIREQYQPWEEFLFRYVLALDLVDGKERMEFVSHNLDEEGFLDRWESLKNSPTLLREGYCPLDGPDDWKTL